MKYLLGIDFGGGASKATLLGEDGKVYAQSTTEYPTYYPKAGYAEQNPDDWVEATCKNISGVLEKSGISPKDIAAAALDAATHTAVITDGDFRVIRPSIYWTDTRSVKEVEYLKENYGDIIRAQALHEPGTIWTLPELLWIKRNEPEIWANVKRIMFAKDYVRHCLTGDYVTDYIEAEGSMMFDVNTMDWSCELCALLDIDTKILPKIVKPSDYAGKVTKAAAKMTGLCEGTPIICGTTDTVMEVFASGAVKKGQMTVKLATAGRICTVTDKPYPDINLVNYSHVIDGL
ncbi:MAG: FGGY family carbohydrate kinase, partial [Clostridiales bacterium]|nr:FGGY family carbohydrate kinase [Clostridiales bacterium]